MPTYDFRCKNCGENFTVQVTIKDKDNTTCPKCGAKELQQKFNKINLCGVSGGNAGSCSSGCCNTCSGCK